MAALPRSRIPRAHSTATAPPPGPPADENAPPPRPAAATARAAAVASKGVRVSAIPLAPATKATRTSARANSALSTTRQSTAPAAPVTHVVIQGPSSDPPAPDGPDSLERATSPRSGFHDERDDGGDHDQHKHAHPVQMPTPPNSQEPASSGEAMLTDQVDQGLLAPARATRRTRSPSTQPSNSRATTTASSRRLSRSPAAETVPDGPAHAPHILAARRRSSMSVSPHPPPTATSTSSSAVASTSATPAGSSAPTTTKPKPKGKRTKLRARPSELLAAPLAAPDADGPDGELDPLLLLGPEHTRGRGEGRRMRGMAAQAQAHGRLSYAPSARAGEAGRASMARLPTPPATQEDDDDDVVPAYQPLVFGNDEPAQEEREQEQEDDHEGDEGDLGGFDEPVYFDDVGQVDDVPYVDDARPVEVEQDGMHDDDEGGFAHLDDADSSAGGYSSPDDDRAATDADDDAAGATSFAIPTVRRTRPSYPPLSPNRTGEWDSTVAVELGSSPPPPMREPTPGFGGSGGARRRSIVGARSRPSYPPLSPNTTGEFDSQCPVRLGSSPPPSPSVAAGSDGEGDGEAARGRPASSEWRDEVDAEVKVEDEQADEDAFLAPRRSTPVPSTSTSAARAATTATTSTPSNLLFLSAFRSPSPALSPIAREGTPSRSPQQQQIQFVSPRKTLDHLTNLVVPSPASAYSRAHSRSPSPLAASSSSATNAHLVAAAAASAPAAAPARLASPGPSASPHPRSTWTRGPAFFRSSSFSPPAHAALPRTATLYARRPGQDEGCEGEDGDEEYHRYADLTATSPMPVAEGEDGPRAHEEAQEEGQGEEDEAVQVDDVGSAREELEREQDRRSRSLSRSASPASAQPHPSSSQDEDDVGPPTPAKDRHTSPAVSASRAADDDEAMASPASSTGSMRSSRAPLASPVRSLNGDVLMSSPSPRNSPAVASAAGAAQARSPGSPSPSVSVEHDGERRDAQQLASTPGRRLVGDDDDARMASPSPARQGSPLKARLGELVGGGRTKLQGLLFGPRASTPRAPAAETDEVERDEPPPRAQAEEQDDDDEQPFQLQPAPTNAQRPRPPASLADSTFTSHSHSRSHASFDSSASTSTSHHRHRRPSHPTLPVIEITSTDPRAAARAAAILKVHHKYVEQGFTAVDAARAAASAFDAAAAAADEDGDSEDEEELRTLLLDAEDELRDQAPAGARSPSVSTAAPSRTATAAGAGARWTSHEWRKLEQALVELGRRQRRATSAASLVGARSMRSESIAMASVVGDECEPETVVEAFLRSVGATREECVGEWAWDTLIIRVEALKARRAKDAQQRRASSLASTSHVGSRRGPRAPIEERVEKQHAHASASASEDGESDHEPTPEAHPVVKQELLSDDDDLGAGSVDADSDASNDDGELADDTFFSSSRRDRARRGSVEPVYVPTALANPALRHLYDDFQPEKPKLPLKDLLREDSPSSSSSSAGGEDEQHDEDRTSSAPRESTPGTAGGCNEPPRSPSSAQRLMSYLGSFVRRSPAPAPSPASSTRALPADSSASPSPSPEMQQVQLSASLVTPRFASTAKPYPPLPASATHKPLPPVAGRVVKPLPHHRSDASSSRATVDAAGAGAADAAAANESTSMADTSAGSSAISSTSFSSRRRRRSSGEGNSSLGRVWAAVDAIEEAESSREEEESRIIELLRTGSAAKRRAAGGDLRERTDDVSSASASAASGSGSASARSKGKGREVDSWRGFVELEEELGRGMIPSGARALDRRVSGERRVSRR
ncbi:hypothetical protein JCM3775_007339 [Rhodotorula graminis]